MNQINEPFWYWFLGFIEGEGSFIISISKDRFSFRISITQDDSLFLIKLKNKLKEMKIKSSIVTDRINIASKWSIDKILNVLVNLSWMTKKKSSFDKFRLAFDLYYCTVKKDMELYETIIKLKLSMNPVSKNKKRKTKEELIKQIKKDFKL